MTDETGGKRANFTARDCLRLAMAIELMQCGVTPERIVMTVNYYWPYFRSYIDLILLGDDRYFFMVSNPNITWDEPMVRFDFLDMRALHDRIFGNEHLSNPRSLSISISGVYERFMHGIKLAGLDLTSFRSALQNQQEPMPQTPLKSRASRVVS